MSLFGSKQGIQAPPPVPDGPPPPPTFASATAPISTAGDFQIRKAFGGFGSTLLTSGQGDTSTPLLGKKTLLGA